MRGRRQPIGRRTEIAAPVAESDKDARDAQNQLPGPLARDPK
jgi:hypothetical protein